MRHDAIAVTQIRASAKPGATLVDAVSDAMELAELAHKDVNLEYNGVHVEVLPYDTVRQACERWYFIDTCMQMPEVRTDGYRYRRANMGR
jgi:hypothetical protein